MKKLFTKMLFIAVLCFGQKQCLAVVSYGKCSIGLVAAVAGVACGAVKLDRWCQSRFANYSQLYNIVLYECKKEVSVNESTARKIFESNDVQQYTPKWYTLSTKVGFMKAFSVYCKNKATLQYECGADKGNATKVLDMVTAYQGYLEKPWMTKRDLVFVGCGIAWLCIGGMFLT